MTASPSDANPSASGNTPGARLGRARDDLRLTREEVAAKLHLATRQIQAIEEDNYAELPGPTYVRGYLKSYALLVGLAPEPLLEAYTLRITQPVAPNFSTIAPAKEITSQHHQVRFVTYVVGAIVIGLAFAWWQGRESETPHPLLEAPLEQPVAGDGAAGVASETGGTSATDTAAAGATAAATPAVPATAPPAVAIAPAPATPVPAPAPAAAPQASPAPVAALSAGPRARLVLVADQDSWVDIRDARQVKLLYENVPAGRTVPLEGVAPLSVFLGNAAGVRIEFNGQNVDVAHYRRGMVARFTLGEAATDTTP